MLAIFSHMMSSSRRYISRIIGVISRESIGNRWIVFAKGQSYESSFSLTWISCWTNTRASKDFSKGLYTWYLIYVHDFRHFYPHNMETFSTLMAPCEENPLMTGVPPHNGLVMQSFGLLLGVVFVLKRHGAHVVSLLLQILFVVNIIPGVQ